ncbi:polysaccharide deacetylase family protein [Methanobacterium oryzae]|uniref:polysaccharide deacetylase family protein n=1 Tax=Methanobacterium oryzae TaxID=69540 RepID=UPI003D1D4F3E
MASTSSEPTPEVIITFDDGFESVYTVAYPIMEQYGIKGTVYVVTGWVGAPGYLTQAQLTELHNAGWTIANHAYKHNYLPSLTEAQMTTEIQTSIDWLNNNGFSDGAYHIAYPYGGYNSNVMQVANNLGIKTGRTTNGGTINLNDNIDYLQLPSKYFDKYTTTYLWKASVDESIATKTTTIFLLHSIVTTPSAQEDVSIDTFTAFIQYVAQTGVKTLTINQWYNELNNPIPVANFTANPTSGTIPLTVQFSDQSTGSSLSYSWDFNNDGTADSTLKNPTYTYNTPGTYTVKLTVTNSIGSDDEIKTNLITVANTMPDLVISNLQIPTNPVVGTTYAVNFTVTNNGTANADSFLVNLMEGSTTIEQQTISSLASGESTTVTINWTPTASGLKTINAAADVNNAITETNETNNNLTKQITVVTQGSTNLLSANQQDVETDLTGFDNYLCTLTRDTSVKYAGNASAKAVASGGFSQLMFAGNGIAVTAGSNYMANAYVRADVGTLGSQTITILYDWYGNDGHLAYNYQMINVSDIGENVWHYLELTATAPTGATSVYMSIALTNSASGDTYWYDNGVLSSV